MSGIGRNLRATISATMRVDPRLDTLSMAEIDDITAVIARKFAAVDWIDVDGWQFDIAPISRERRARVKAGCSPADAGID